MRLNITLPDLGEDSVQAVTVSGWMTHCGQSIAEGDDLIELTTDKAAFTLPSPAAGTLAEQCVKDGDGIHVGDILGVLEVAD